MYRAADVTTARRPLGRVTLAGPPSVVHRAIALVRLVAAIVAMGAMFLPWHVVRETNWGGGFCWAPDCHASPGSTTYGPAKTCTGFSDGHPIATLLVLALLAAINIVAHRRPRLWPAMGVAGASALLLVALFYAVFNLAHLFDHVETLNGERLFGLACALLALTTLLDLLGTPLLYLWARARLPRLPTQDAP